MSNTNHPDLSPSDAVLRRKVLIVDDSVAQRRVLMLQLRRAGFDVHDVGSGDEALAYCQDHQPDFILSDWMMPGMTGPELCMEFRKIERESYGYFILLTSRAEKEDIARGLASGADDFLIKPVSAAELTARLSAGERVLSMQDRLREGKRALEKTLEDLRAAQAAMERDLKEARKLQQGLIKERHGRFGAVNLSLLMRPAGHVGGDLVGFFPINHRRVGIFAFDVSGHGVTSALLTARLAGHFSAIAEQNIALFTNKAGEIECRPPADLALLLNQMMIEDLRTDTYLTMCFAEIDTVSGELRLVQAGHPHPLLQRKSGEIEVLGHGGLPIGMFESAQYQETTARLRPGDRLLICSDGITEASHPVKGALLGEEGLCAILQTNAPLSGAGFLESLAWSVEQFSRGRREDDISAVFVEYGGEPSEN